MASKSCGATRHIAASVIRWGVLLALVHATHGLAVCGESPQAAADQAEVLCVPAMTVAPATAGRRVRQTPPEYVGTEVHHSLYLPPDWRPDWQAAGQRWPVIVEYTGNFAPNLGSTGEVANAALGFGLCGGQGLHLGRYAVRRPRPSPQRTDLVG